MMDGQAGGRAERPKGRYLNFLTRKHLEVVKCCSTDPTRLELQGVGLDFSLGFLVATDGHCMIRMPVELPDELRGREMVTLHPTLFAYLSILPDYTFGGLSIEFLSGAVRIHTGEGANADFPYMPGPYPAYLGVFEEQKEPYAVDVNPELLLKVKAALGLKNKEGLRIQVDTSRPDAAVYVRSGEMLLGAVMPLRTSPGRDVHGGAA